jgi:hypothetical protein
MMFPKGMHNENSKKVDPCVTPANLGERHAKDDLGSSQKNKRRQILMARMTVTCSGTNYGSCRQRGNAAIR